MRLEKHLCLRSRMPVVAAALLCSIVWAGCSRDPHAEMLKYSKSGDEYATAGKLAEAIIEYRNAVQAEPRAGEARVKLAEAYLRHGEGAKAVAEYVRAADALPDPQTQIKAGSLLLLARRFDDAKVRAEKAISADPKSVEAQILLANALAGLKDLDGAVTELQQAIQLSPDRSATYSTLGAIELGRGNREAAERAFKRAVELAPHAAESHLALGSFYWTRGQWADAERELADALAADPNNALAHRTMATFYLVTNRRDRAEEHLKRDREITKSTTSAIALADYYVAQNKEAAARQVLEPLTRNAQSAAVANTRLAALDEVTGHSESAKKRLEDVLSTEPTQLSALLIKSGFLLKEGNPDESLKVAQFATESHPDSAPAFSAVGRAQSAKKNTAAAVAAYREAVRLNPLATDAKVALAQLELASGHADSAASLAQDALKAQPQNPDARLALIRALISRSDLARAETELNALAERFPDSMAVHTQRGMLFGRQKKTAEARREFERALQIQADALEATGGLVALDLSTRQGDAARARADELARRPDAKPAALMLAARTYAATSDLKSAEQLLRRIVSADPSYLGAYAALGQIYAKQGRLDAAVAEFEALAQRDPKPVVALTMAGMMLEGQGKTDAARQHYERVMQLDASAPVAANNLAWIYAQSDSKLDIALGLAQTAQQKLPDTAEVNDTLGFIYYKKGLLPQAIRTLSSAVEKDGNAAGYHYHLGLALANNGDKAGASEHLSRALALKSDFDGAADATTRLKALANR